MKWASGLYAHQTDLSGLGACADEVMGKLDAKQSDLAIAFVSPHFRDRYEEVADALRQHLAPNTFVGCSGMAVIGAGREIEHEPGISILTATLPNVTCHALYTDTEDLPDNDAPPDTWKAWLGVPSVDRADFVLLADPFSAAIEQVVLGIDYAFPNATVVGGLASAAGSARENALFLNNQIYRQGMVGLALEGDIRIDSVVAQGCKPIGKPLTVTCCNHNLLLEANGEAPVKLIEELIPTLDDYDRRLLKTSLFLGLEIDPFKNEPQQGDFLIRNVLGVDYENGAMAIGAALHEGQVVQFHLRDKVTSSLDLDLMFTQHQLNHPTSDPAGALLFSCLGRGEQLYGESNHDTNRFLTRLGDIPISGFFCNGEIGPVGTSTYVHGYTSSFGIFRPRTPTGS